MKGFFTENSKLSMARLTSFLSHLVAFSIGIIGTIKGTVTAETVALVGVLIGGGVTSKVLQKKNEK
jgi:hypothetical protein